MCAPRAVGTMAAIFLLCNAREGFLSQSALSETISPFTSLIRLGN